MTRKYCAKVSTKSHDEAELKLNLKLSVLVFVVFSSSDFHFIPCNRQIFSY